MIIEVCVDNLESVEACARAGADRIELCAGLVEGGTTPSLGFLRAARRRFPGRIMTMIRPRGGDFLYGPAEVEAMREDIRVARGEGAEGVVFGCLRADGSIDEAVASDLLGESAGLDATFHRAFDASRDLPESLEALVRLGFSRILTSGGAATAWEGLDSLAALNRRAGDRIIVLPGGGITADRVAEVARRTGVGECHLSARETRPSPMGYRRESLAMGAAAVPGEYERRVAGEALIRLARGLPAPG